jgi:hypothetical protein
MSRWAKEVFESPPPLVPPPQRASVTVEQQLLNRLGHLREVLVDEALAREWEPEAVDRVLAAGGLEPLTREYDVDFIEEVTRSVRVRAKDRQQASELANGNGGRLVGVREVSD